MNSHTPLPAGLTDRNVEFFQKDDKLYGLRNGKVKHFDDLPPTIIQIIGEELHKDPIAQKHLVKWQHSIKENWSYAHTLQQYAKCKWGGFDCKPDLLNGKAMEGEYWDCGLRDTCPHQGKICKQFKVKHGHLTWREIEVLKLIHAGMQDKEIADELNLSVQTIPSFKKNIQEKTECRSKTEMAVFAEINQIV